MLFAVIITIVSAVLVLFVYVTPEVMLVTYQFGEWCESLFIRCLEYLDIIKFILLSAGPAIILSGFVYAAFKGLSNIIKSHYALKNLSTTDKGSVRLIKDDKTNIAFTYGFLKPRIYISTGLIKNLERDELLSVFFHELLHLKMRDPLKFFIMNFIKDAFYYVSIGGVLLKHLYNIKERLADDSAAIKISPVYLSSALVKIARGNDYMLDKELTSIKGFGSIEARIQRLIEGKEINTISFSLKKLLTSAIAIAFLFLSLSMPAFSLPVMENCGKEHCLKHHKQGSEHCEKHNHTM